MPNYNGFLGAIGQDDGFPDAQKTAPDLFQQLGILSPSEKQAAAMKQQQAMALLQQQNELVRQQQMIQKAQLGSGYGFSVLTALGGTRSPQSAFGLTPPQQGPDVSGIAGKLISQEYQNTPDDPVGAQKRAGIKLLQLANQSGNGDLQKIAVQTISNANQQALKQNQTKAQTANTQSEALDRNTRLGMAIDKLGNPGDTFQGHAPNGDIVSFAPQHDARGRFTGYKVITQGPNKQVTQTLDDPRTATQKGAEYLDFQNLLTNSGVALRTMDDITKGLEEGAAQGWAAVGVRAVDNAIGTLQQLAPGATLTADAQAALGDKEMQNRFALWASKTGINRARWMDLVQSLARSYNGKQVTENDVKRAADVVGANYSNPATVAAVLKDAKKRTLDRIDETYSNMGDDARSSSQPQYDRFMSRFGSQPTQTSQTSSTNDNPDDYAPAGMPYPKSKAEYDALPAGTQYFNPHIYDKEAGHMGKVVTKRG